MFFAMLAFCANRATFGGMGRPLSVLNFANATTWADVRNCVRLDFCEMANADIAFAGANVDMDIRDATSEDLDTLLALNTQVQDLHAQLEPSHFRAATEEVEVRAFFAKIISTPHNHILLAVDEAGPRGYLWFELQHRPQTPFTQPRRRLYVQISPSIRPRAGAERHPLSF